MSQRYHKKNLKSKSKNKGAVTYNHQPKSIAVKGPAHTEELYGHKTDEMIIIYSKYEDLFDRKPGSKGKYVPQWVGYNCVDEEIAQYIEIEDRIMCDHDTMEIIGRKITDAVPIKINKIKFKRVSHSFVLNGITPFKDLLNYDPGYPRKLTSEETKLVHDFLSEVFDSDKKSNEQKTPKSNIPVHTENLKGHHENDIIIIYSKYEDLFPIKENQDPNALGLLVPQWFGTDCVNERRGVFLPTNEPIICTYKEMEEMGRKGLSEMINGKLRKAIFLYKSNPISINGMQPFL